MSVGACVWFYLQPLDMRNAVYAAIVLMGSGGSVMLVTSLSMIADLVGDDKVHLPEMVICMFTFLML